MEFNSGFKGLNRSPGTGAADVSSCRLKTSVVVVSVVSLFKDGYQLQYLYIRQII